MHPLHNKSLSVRRDSKLWYEFSFEIQLFFAFGTKKQKNREIYHLLIMANLSPVLIFIIEVAMRIDRKCQKDIYTLFGQK